MNNQERRDMIESIIESIIESMIESVKQAREGYQAYTAGFNSEQNPYKMILDAGLAWHSGWVAAQKDFMNGNLEIDHSIRPYNTKE